MDGFKLSMKNLFFYNCASYRKKTAYTTKANINIRIIIPVPFQPKPPTRSDILLPLILLEGFFNSSCLNLSLLCSGVSFSLLIQFTPKNVLNNLTLLQNNLYSRIVPDYRSI